MAPIITLVIAIAAATVYTVVVHRRAEDQVWAWWHGLVATFVSVFLALATGFWVYARQQAAAEAAERSTLRTVVEQELSTVKSILINGGRADLTVAGKTYPVLLTYLQPLALEKAAQSGLFGPVETANMLITAQKIRTFNTEEQFLTALVGSGSQDSAFPSRVEFALRNMEQTKRGILDDIEVHREELKLRLVDLH